MPIAPRDQCLRRHLSCRHIVDPHHIGLPRGPSKGMHHRDPRIAKGAGKTIGQVRGCDNDALDRILPQHLHRTGGVGFV